MYSYTFYPGYRVHDQGTGNVVMTERRILITILLAALNLRIGITTIGPLVNEIRPATGISSAVAGVLTALPFLCMGIFALLGSTMIRRLGYATVVLLSLSLIAVGSIGRVAVPSALLLLVGTVPLGVGIAFISVAIPGIVQQHFPGRANSVTSQYVASSSFGGTIAALVAVPVAGVLGGWQWALMATSATALAALLLWPRFGIRRSDMPAPSKEAAISWKAPGTRGLLLGTAFGLEAMCFSGGIAWAAPLYEASGWTAAMAAVGTAAILLVILPGSLLAPAFAARLGSRRCIVGAAMMLALGLAGMSVLETTAGWVWIALVGLGLGAMFTLMLALPVELSSSALGATNLAAWMQGIGYAIAASGPILVGAVRDLSEGFGLPFLLLAAVALASGLMTAPLCPSERTSDEGPLSREGPATATDARRPLL